MNMNSIHAAIIASASLAAQENPMPFGHYGEWGDSFSQWNVMSSYGRASSWKTKKSEARRKKNKAAKKSRAINRRKKGGKS